MTQVERLETYLESHASITPLEAWNLLGIYRLSAAVHTLKKKGRKIETELVKVSNQFGESCHVAQYRFGG
jgi:cob(I)alamin adenosyltransferase